MMKSFVPMLVLSAFFMAASQAKDQALYSHQSLSLETAVKAAQAALQACRQSAYQVAVAVVDRGGTVQVVLRDRLAGVFMPDAAVLKARTAVGFRNSTTSLAEAVERNKDAQGIHFLPGVLILGGGVLIEAAGTNVGAIGVAGAPTPAADEECAIAGIEAVQDVLDF